MNNHGRDYVNKFKKTNDSFEVLISNETYFRDKFTQFLFSPKGAIFQVINMSFNNNVLPKKHTNNFVAKLLVL